MPEHDGRAESPEAAALLEAEERIAQRVAFLLKRTLDDRPLYKIETLAIRLGLAERTVADMLAKGVLPSMLIGVNPDGKGKSQRRIDPAVVDAYLDARRRVG